jgi:hypothetical protein
MKEAKGATAPLLGLPPISFSIRRLSRFRLETCLFGTGNANVGWFDDRL